VIAEYKRKIIKELQSQFGLSEEAAISKLNNSAFSDLLEVDPRLVFHYAPSYWAKVINKSIKPFV
jgi:hypothetical protein